MIRSMTGFGEAEVDTPRGRLRAELRSVNHRYFSANLKLSRPIERWEPQVREWLRARLPRGHVSCTIRLEAPDVTDAPPLKVDEARARQYVAALMALKERLGITGEVTLDLLTRFGDIIGPADADESPVPEEALRKVTESAADAVIRMREEEGLRLAADLEERLRGIEAALDVIAARAPERLVVERDRIRRVVGELLGDTQVDDERVAREIAFLAERWDVSEELVRLRSHIELFREALAASAEEPAGKRLGFLVQEMNRETNTIGSKANDAPIEHRVIAIKEEIERLREQVENVE